MVNKRKNDVRALNFGRLNCLSGQMRFDHRSNFFRMRPNHQMICPGNVLSVFDKKWREEMIFGAINMDDIGGRRRVFPMNGVVNGPGEKIRIGPANHFLEVSFML